MNKYKILILGGGCAGLTFANKLLQLGESNFLVLESGSEAGGLCRSKNINGSPLDMGGGHFLDVKNSKVLNFIFSFLPENNWIRYKRDSRIEINGSVISSPFESNIWQFPITKQVEYLKTIAVAGCNLSIPMPEKFIDWIYWKLGSKIADDYMIPYNQKIFGENLNILGTYWLNKLPNVSFDETLISCLERKAYGIQPGHAQFFYPKKYGYGEVWLRMAKALGDKIHYNESVFSIDYDTKTVNNKYKADLIVTTVPWTSIKKHIHIPEDIKEAIGLLKHTSIVINYRQEMLDTRAHWIYYPDHKFEYHRILVRHNFCPDSRGYWTETNLERFVEKEHEGEDYFINDYAYPLNTILKPVAINKILTYADSKDVIGLGRWGEWQHYNSDVVVDLALKKADEIIQRLKK